jgi:2,5-diketo-D-gluconate reductase A
VDEPAIGVIAEKHQKSPAQVILRWHMQKGNVAIPKSATPARIVENISIFDFELDESDMLAIDLLDRGNRLGPHPDLR